MNYLKLLQALPVFLLISSASLLATEDAAKKQPKLEEMSTEELKAALKKSHAEIESRLSASTNNSEINPEDTTRANEKIISLSDKHNYETSAQNRIDLLNYKIQALETNPNKHRGYAASDAYKLRTIQSKAREQLIKIKSDNTDGWKTNKQILDSLLRDASYY